MHICRMKKLGAPTTLKEIFRVCCTTAISNITCSNSNKNNKKRANEKSWGFTLHCQITTTAATFRKKRNFNIWQSYVAISSFLFLFVFSNRQLCNNCCCCVVAFHYKVTNAEQINSKRTLLPPGNFTFQRSWLLLPADNFKEATLLTKKTRSTTNHQHWH